MPTKGLLDMIQRLRSEGYSEAEIDKILFSVWLVPADTSQSDKIEKGGSENYE